MARVERRRSSVFRSRIPLLHPQEGRARRRHWSLRDLPHPDQPDGSFLEGAQGISSPPYTQATRPLLDARLRALGEAPPDPTGRLLERQWLNYGAPWVIGKEAFLADLSNESIASATEAQTPFVFPRQGTSRTHPPHIPSQIGLQNLKYLDATGLVRNRSMADIMRYAITNQGLDTLAHYGEFSAEPGRHELQRGAGYPLSDGQLYAMALYIYSLKPPSNPNPVDAQARHGEAIFGREGCSGCHPAPLYTNNKLTRATSVRIPEDLRRTDDILNGFGGNRAYTRHEDTTRHKIL